MFIDQEKITNKLKEEGINEAIGSGLKFETEDELDSWVATYKEANPTVKGLTDYTKEELEEIAKDPQFKGAKGLQGFLDSLRQKQAAKQKEKPPKESDKNDEDGDDKFDILMQEIENLKNKNQAFEADREQAALTKKVEAKFSDHRDVRLVLNSIAAGASVDDAITEHEDYLKSKNVSYVPGGGRNQSGSADLKSSMEAWKKQYKK